MAERYSYRISVAYEKGEGTSDIKDASKGNTTPSDTFKGDGTDSDDESKNGFNIRKTTNIVQQAIKNPLGALVKETAKKSVPILIALAAAKTITTVLNKTGEYIELYTGDNRMSMAMRNANSILGLFTNPLQALFTYANRRAEIYRSQVAVEQKMIATGTSLNGKGGYTI